jgi:segregation and condensation protein A
MSYKVDLEIYNGPMDLLLYLIRREEVDIREIPISRIADQYIAYLDMLKGLDIELAGDFIVMAATLLELKSAAVLPRPPEPEETQEAEAEEDPRETLIRQLLEYRRFKEASAMLDGRSRDMARRFPREVDDRALAGLTAESEIEVPAEFLKGVEVWDLISAFSQVIRTLGYSESREVIYDDTPVEEASRKLIERIEAEKSLLFSQLFTGGHSRVYLVTMFIAILELVRQRKIGVEQDADFKDVRLYLREPAAEPPVPQDPVGAEDYKEALERKGPRRPSARQTDNLRGMIEEVDFEKTEFDHILDSINVPEVESFRPIYTEDELLGKKGEGAEAGSPGTEAAAASAPPSDAEAPADTDADNKSEGAGEADSDLRGGSPNPPLEE